MKQNDDAETIEYRGYTIHIQYDDTCESPREWDNLGTMVCWHRRDNYGDEQPKDDPIDYMIQKINEKQQRDNDYENIAPGKVQQMFQRDNLVIPIMAYEHGGITIRAYDYGNFPDQQWDCGQLGFIYVSKDKIRAEYGNAGKRNMEKARQCLLSEIVTYDQYLRGDVYEYIVEDEDEGNVDSCWGYYGQEDAIEEAKSQIDYVVKEAQEKQYLSQPYLIGLEV